MGARSRGALPSVSSGHAERCCRIGGAGAWPRPIVEDTPPHRRAAGALTGRLGRGGTAPEQTLPMAALSVSIPATESNGQGRKGSADPSSGNFTSPFASKGTCVLEFGQGRGFIQPPWRNCVRVCECMRVLEERCVWVALGKEGSCSLTAEHHSIPRILGFHGTAGLF